MIIVRIKSLNADREQRKRIREELQEQTRQEVIVLPCECKLEQVSEELELGTIEAVEVKGQGNGRKLKAIELINKSELCPLQLGIEKKCNDKGCKECWEEVLESESKLKCFTAKDVKQILKNIEGEWNGLR